MTVVSIAARRSRSPRRRAPEIIEAAARVFAERGFHGATTQDIADVLGIRQASLYYYFPSKEVALELVCLDGVEGFFEAAKAIAAGPGSAGERLERLIRSHISPLLDRGDFVKVFLNERQYPADREPPAHRQVVARPRADLRRRHQGRRAQRRVPPRSRPAARDAGDPRHGATPSPAWYRKEEAPIERIADEVRAARARRNDQAAKPPHDARA